MSLLQRSGLILVLSGLTLIGYVEARLWNQAALADSPTNVALASNGATVVASSANPSRPASSVINGNRRGSQINAGDLWEAPQSLTNVPAWLEVSFAGNKTITEIDVIGLQDGFSSDVAPTIDQNSFNFAQQDYLVQYWTGSAWATVPGGIVSGNYRVWKQFIFGPLTTNKIRVYVTRSIQNYAQLVEVEAYGVNASGGTTTVTAPATVSGTVGQSLSVPVSASGGSIPYAYILSGTVPAGLSITCTQANCATATISGTPSQAGNFPVTVTATDSGGSAGSTQVTFTITTSTPGITPTNVALASNGATVVASSANSSRPASSVINGNRRGSQINAGDLWEASQSLTNVPAWVEVSFAGSKTITEINVIGLQDGFSSDVAPTIDQNSFNFAQQDYLVQYWTGSAWATVPGGIVSGNYRVWKQFIFGPLTTNKIRVYVTRSIQNYAQLVEVEAYGVNGPLNRPPSGYLDVIDSTTHQAFGWSYDRDGSSLSNTVSLYIDGTDNAHLIENITANQPRPDINQALGISGDHGFAWTIPSVFNDGLDHMLYVFGRDLTDSSITTHLIRSPKPFNFAPSQTGNSSELVYDSFYKVNNATTLPPADTGQPWIMLDGTIGVTQFKAYFVALGSGFSPAAVIDSGQSGETSRLTVRVTLDTLSGGTAGLTLRAIDGANRFIARASNTGIELIRIQNGGFTMLARYTGTVNNGDDLSVELLGSVITVKQNGQTRITVSDTFNQNATKHGIHFDHGAPRLKHFVITTTPQSTDWIRISKPYDYQIFQRNSAGRADIPVSGSYSGNVTSIIARFNGGPWQTLVANPSGGTFSGTLANQPASQGLLEVRFSNNALVSWQKRYVGIGDVFLVAGQSNAEGRITAPQYYSHPTLRAGVVDEANNRSGKWREAYDPTDADFTNQYSIWPIVATKLMAQTGLPVGFITAARFQTALATGGSTQWGPNGSSFNQAVQLVQNSGLNNLRCILWFQGESDANSVGMTKDTYLMGLRDLRTRFAASLGFGDLDMGVVQLAYLHIAGVSTETRTTLDAVRIAQSEAGSIDPRIFLLATAYDLPKVQQSRGGDGVHVTDPGEGQILASRISAMILSRYFGGSQNRGPRFASAHFVDSTHVDVVFTVSNGTGLSMPASTAAGWRVRDNGNSGAIVPVTTTVLQNNFTVRLTLSSPIAGPATVSWASYNDSVGLALTDNGDLPLPVEPFVTQPIQ